MTDPLNSILATIQNPYVGPRAFKTGEKLYGRDRETAELLDLIIAERIVMLYSPSGAGKSSLLNAALNPELKKQGFEILPPMRVNQEPPSEFRANPGFNRYVFSALVSIESTLDAKVRFTDEELSTLRFAEYLKKIRERAAKNDSHRDERFAFVLLFDQMEEILTVDPTDRDAKQEFFLQVGECLRDRGLYALFSLREDYLAGLDPYLRPVPTRLANRYRLDLLSANAAIQAIREPAGDQGVDFERDAAGKLADNLRQMRVQQADGTTTEQPGLYVEPVQLQVVCRRLWMQVPRESKKITLDNVTASGNIDTALAGYYASQVSIAAAETKVSERAIREWVNNQLITVQGLRGQVQLAPDASAGLNNEAIWFLEKLRIVRAEKRGGITWFELAHDRLIQPIRDDNEHWFNENLNLFQRTADLWNQQGRPDGMLLRGVEFLAAEQWAQENWPELLAFEQGYFQACQKAHAAVAREQRTNRIIRWLFIASIFISIVAVYFFFKARDAEQLATAREFGAQAKSVAQSQPELSVLLGLQSMAGRDSMVTETEQALRLALPSMRVERIYSEHTEKVYSVVFSPDGTLLASASNDGTAKIWDVKTSTVVSEFKVDAGLTYAVFSPDGRHISISTKDGHILTYDVSDGAPVHDIEAHTDVIWWLAYSPDGSRIVSASSDMTAKVWDSVTCELLLTLEGHASDLWSVAYSPDGNQIATASGDQTVRIWDARTGELLFRLTGHGGAVNAIAYTADGTRLASSCTDRLIRIWDMNTGELQMSITGHRDWVWGLAFSRDGSTFYSSSSDRTIRSWDTTYGRPIMTLYGHSDQVFSVALSPDEKYIASASQDKTVRLWDVSPAGSYELFTLDYKDRVYDLTYAPDGTLFAAAGRDQKVHVYDAKTQQELLPALEGHERAIQAVAFSPDSKLIASGSYDGTVRLWNVATGETVNILEYGNEIDEIAFSGDGKRLVAGGAGGNVMVWDVASGDVLYTVGDTPDAVFSVAYSPDNLYFAAGYYNDELYGYIRIWDANTGKLVQEMPEAHDDIVRNLAFSPDSQYLASASDDGFVKVWNLTAKGITPYKEFDMASGTLYSVNFSADGKFLVSGGIDGLARFWEWNTDKLNTHSLYGNADRVYDAVFSPDGRNIVTVGADGTIRGFVTSNEDLQALASRRLLRSFSSTECELYHVDPCTTEKTVSPPPLEITPYPVKLFVPNTFTPTPTFESRRDFTATPSPSVTPASKEPPSFTATQDAYCRSGPGPQYEIVMGIRSGDTVPVIGISEPGIPHWWVVTVLDTQCWVYAELGEANGDLTGIPVYRTPPTPIPTKTFTSTPKAVPITPSTPSPTFTPTPKDTTPPPAPVLDSPKDGVSLSCRSGQDLSWLAVTDASGIREYRIQVQQNNGSGKWNDIPGSLFISKTTSTTVPVNCGGIYRWRVLAVDNSNNIGSWSGWYQFGIQII